MGHNKRSQLIRTLAFTDENGFDVVTELLIQELVNYNPNDEIVKRVREAIYINGMVNKINGIKEHRNLTGATLKDSKEWVEKTFGL